MVSKMIYNNYVTKAPLLPDFSIKNENDELNPSKNKVT